MNINPETDLDLDKLFLPAWAQEPASVNRYEKFTGGEDRSAPTRRGWGEERRERGPRPPRREGAERSFGGPRRDDRPRDQSGPRREGRQGRPQREERSQPRRDARREPREAREAPPPPEINVALVPDEKGVESLARQIKMSGRAYPLFEIARLILQKPDRYAVHFSVKKNAEGQVVQPLFLCALDETLWLTEDEAVGHVLNKHFTTFYQAERTATEPPKGKYTFVGQCGMSGIILGPPNHHDYQNRLHKLHAERFSRMPFEVFKSRIRIVRDEEVVKQWVEEQSWKTEYLCLNIPEPLKLASREEVEQHFRQTHKDAIIKTVEAHTVSGVAARGMRCQGLARLAREVSEDQRRFPLQLATGLSQQFARHGLQFFKVNKTVTHVSVARPHFLDLETTPVSEGVRRIVDFIVAHPKCTRRQLLEALVPTPPPPPIPVAPVSPEPGTIEAGPPGESGTPVAEASAPAPGVAEPTAEQTAVIADLHWLIHQGHVIEFANGVMETAKRPAPKPPRPETKPASAPAEGAAPPPVAEPAPVEVAEPAPPATLESPVEATVAAPLESTPSPADPVAAVPSAVPEETPAASV